MRVKNAILKPAAVLLAVLVLVGCFSKDVNGRKYAVRDPIPVGTPKGFADFTLSPSSNVQTITVRRSGDNRFAGADTVHLFRNGSSLLRIGSPPGRQRFIIGSTVVLVPIIYGKINKVEVEAH
jgi:hypothetical protein